MSTTLNNVSFRQTLFSSLLNADTNIKGSQSINDNTITQWSVGSAAGSVDGIATGTINVVSGTPLLLDLTALANSALDVGGLAASALHLVAFKIQNNSSTVGQTLTIGGGTNAISATNPLPIDQGTPFGWGSLSSGGLAITGTTKILQITASTGTIPVSITLLTRSA